MSSKLEMLKREALADDIRPEWVKDRNAGGTIPQCTDRCPSHDGKRCEHLGSRAPEGHCCTIMVARMVEEAGEVLG